MMAVYATHVTATVPLLDRVVIDTPALGWWISQGYIGRHGAGFETALTIAPGSVRIMSPSLDVGPRVDLWHKDQVTGSLYVSLSGDPPFLLEGVGEIAFDPANIPDLFQFLWPRLGIDAQVVLTADERAELYRLQTGLPTTRWGLA